MMSPSFGCLAYGAYRHATKELIHMYMTAEPRVLLHIKAWFYIGILAIWKCCYKQINFYNFACLSINISHSWTAPINFAPDSRFMCQVIGKGFCGYKCTVIFAKFRITYRYFTFGFTPGFVFFPK